MAREGAFIMADTARVLIFTGEGKGKTTAALGMALRASGYGFRILIIQFVKEADTGEIHAVNAIKNIKIVQAGLGFLPDKADTDYCRHQRAAEKGLAFAEESIESGGYDLIVLDEICFSVDRGLLQEDEVIRVLSKATAEMSLVLTGRGATDRLIEIADTVSHIQCVKHGYEKGIMAQKGVEF